MTRKAEGSDLDCAALLAGRLWPGHTQEKLRRELAPDGCGDAAALFL